ncbi:4Fe-4S dicluster domain-containing protein [Clostridium sp. DJ247]|uniref:4Fe-4S dicluster domain-containing protein n=1 Tax=Clostridium sp. DJ247 TaxID=2726188 RepID=UPI001627B9B4|nr:4Fe-4S dicluster domain-containing protein [Clostridium sp. DJ247]MBC2581117.1 4Fe-4S binding protein [Clostridium sp. DJ247]
MNKSKKVCFLKADPTYCVGCKNCELACASRKAEKYEKENIIGNISIESNIIISQGESLKIPAYCRHCKDAFCEKLCPTKAISRENHVVMLNNDKCIGCGICKQACPYGVITMGTYNDGLKTKKFANKCDLCADRQMNDEEPSCYAACPTKALKLV